jgi:non-ribosomal peptide synthetase component E (peptide arylation enzyme)
MKVEEAIAAAGAQSCVVSIADDRRGERLVALYVHAEMEPAELWRRLAETDLPRLWLPKREDLYRVDAIPQLGTGKVDLRAARSIAGQAHDGPRVGPQDGLSGSPVPHLHSFSFNPEAAASIDTEVER